MAQPCEFKRRARMAMAAVSATAMALVVVICLLESGKQQAPISGGEQWLEDGRASVNMFRVARSPMMKAALRGAPLPRQVHYYSNVGDRLPVLGDEERETRQTFQELVQLGHTCVVMLRRAIWSVDPTVFKPQYNLQVHLDAVHTALGQLAAQTGVYLTNPPVVNVDESVFDDAASDVSRFRKLVERIPEMHNAQFYWVVQYNVIRTELRKASSELTEVVNIAKHHFLEVADSIDSMRMNVEAIHE
eukprot:CAMPEP_0173386296 /NCGR_PEP_ID=MMETSP1356-20130122/8893_1 /TAXON_ID=77927 ORGANISM="Hemiselmis virescens, Strain PCC157" /NCGR_SAMPLE_ID=MMETSP1356 /ASSEMBLY_ACC=CAM_ASM_000847 /LENGTH=245 /DNA_ID=CAMNT_0014342471 /DNA_START=21 /DNA_END=758 /DNA_ORIENTATION=-